ncbi:unnamed protein product [Rhodiola kirilowii]
MPSKSLPIARLVLLYIHNTRYTLLAQLPSWLIKSNMQIRIEVPFRVLKSFPDEFLISGTWHFVYMNMSIALLICVLNTTDAKMQDASATI